MGARILSLVFLLAAPLALDAAGTATMHRANPVRKVVTMLQMMEQKVTAQGKAEEELHEKFMCYCKSSGGELGASIDAAKKKIPELESAIEEGGSQGKQMAEDLAAHKSDRAAAKAAMAEATAIREKENKAYMASDGEAKTNLAALEKAIAAIEKGAGGSFLQTNSAAVVRNIAFASTDMSDVDRQDLLSFLSASQGGEQGEFTATSSEVLGIMKQLYDEMIKGLEEEVAAEKGAVTAYEELMAAKGKQVASLTKMIEDKTQRVGEGAVGGAEAKNDLKDTQESLADDEAFLANLDKECATREAEWEARQKLRSEELLAIADTIKLMNSDEALELFKKTLPGAASSFVQIQVSAKSMRSQALSLLNEARRHSKRPMNLDFIALALHGKKQGFEAVIKMIDNMAATLKTEQGDDDDKKAYCEKEFDSAEDEEKGLKNAAADLDTAIADAEEGIATLKSEIEALSDGITALDKSVGEATEQRKEENEDYEELMASNTAAKDLIAFAKNRMNKFYNPKLYKAPPTTAAPMLMQMSARSQLEGAPTEESGGVIAMMDTMIADLDKEMTEAKVEEKDAQADYETMMADSASKRAQDSKTITDKEGAVAETETQLETHKGDKASTVANLMKTAEYIGGLHKECDWLLQNFEARKGARAAEVEAMGKAKAVLSGADYALLQTSERTRVTRRKFLRRA